MTIHPRSDWTSTPPANSTPFVASEVLGAAVHWNGPAVPLTAYNGDPRAYLEGVRRYHVNSNGWSDIAYNLAVDTDGDIWILRGLDYRSAANGAVTVNDQYVAILCILGLGQHPTPAMIEGVRQAIGLVRGKYPKAQAIKGHRQIRPEPTDCPGDEMFAHVLDGSLDPSKEQDVPITDAEFARFAKIVADNNAPSATVDWNRFSIHDQTAPDGTSDLQTALGKILAAVQQPNAQVTVDATSIGAAIAAALAADPTFLAAVGKAVNDNLHDRLAG